MQKKVFSILAGTYLFLASASALTVIDRNGNVYQSSEPDQKSSNRKVYSSYYDSPSQAPSRKDYYDEWGRLQGYSKKESYSDKTNHYNEWGQQKGYSKRDSFSGDVKHYNEWGQLQGTTKSRP